MIFKLKMSIGSELNFIWNIQLTNSGNLFNISRLGMLRVLTLLIKQIRFFQMSFVVFPTRRNLQNFSFIGSRKERLAIHHEVNSLISDFMVVDRNFLEAIFLFLLSVVSPWLVNVVMSKRGKRN